MAHLRPQRTNCSSYLFSHFPTSIAKPYCAFSFVLLLANLFRVPIIILITTTSAVTTVSAVSLASISVPTHSTHHEIDSGNYNTIQQPLIDILNRESMEETPLSYELQFARTDNGEKIFSAFELSGIVEPLRSNDRQNDNVKLGVDRISKLELLKKTGGDTRISSNQDVTTLALAIDNSSSVAIANINSSYNNVFVSIANPSHLQPPYPYNETNA